MKKVIFLLLILTTLAFSWENGQPGNYQYNDYSYQDYSYDVTPPSNGDYNYNTGTFDNSYNNDVNNLTPNINDN